jgi:hypothetical protein
MVMLEKIFDFLFTLDREMLLIPFYVLYHVFLYKIGFWKTLDKDKHENTYFRF